MTKIVSLVIGLVIALTLSVGVSTTATAKDKTWLYCNSQNSVVDSTVAVADSATDKNDSVWLYPGDCIRNSQDAKLISTVSKSYRISYGKGYGKCKPGAAWWNPSAKHTKTYIKNYSQSNCKNS